MMRLCLVCGLGLFAWLMCGVAFAQDAPSWPEIPEPTPKPVLPNWVRVVGDGSTEGMPCEVRTASGQSLGTLQTGTKFIAFNIDARDVTLPIRGRIGRIPRTAVVPLTPEEMRAAETVRDNEEAAAQARANRAARLADAERIARQAAPPRKQQQVAAAGLARFGSGGSSGVGMSGANPSSRSENRGRTASGSSGSSGRSSPRGKPAGGSSPKKCPPGG